MSKIDKPLGRLNKKKVERIQINKKEMKEKLSQTLQKCKGSPNNNKKNDMPPNLIAQKNWINSQKYITFLS